MRPGASVLTVRTSYAHPSPACCAHQRRRAACPQGATHCTYAAVRVPASGVPNVPRAVAPQAIYGAMGESVPHDPAAPPAAAEGGGEEVLDEQIDEADDDDE